MADRSTTKRQAATQTVPTIGPVILDGAVANETIAIGDTGAVTLFRVHDIIRDDTMGDGGMCSIPADSGARFTCIDLLRMAILVFIYRCNSTSGDRQPLQATEGRLVSGEGHDRIHLVAVNDRGGDRVGIQRIHGAQYDILARKMKVFTVASGGHNDTSSRFHGVEGRLDRAKRRGHVEVRGSRQVQLNRNHHGTIGSRVGYDGQVALIIARDDILNINTHGNRIHLTGWSLAEYLGYAEPRTGRVQLKPPMQYTGSCVMEPEGLVSRILCSLVGDEVHV